MRTILAWIVGLSLADNGPPGSRRFPEPATAAFKAALLFEVPLVFVPPALAIWIA